MRLALLVSAVWLTAYELVGIGVDIAIGQDDPPRCSTGLDGEPCCYQCECKGCKCDVNAGRKCCEGCGCVFVESCCCCTEEPPVFKVPADPIPLKPGIKKLSDGTYDLTAFFKAELKKKEAAQYVVCGVGCCCCEGCKCEDCDCGCPVLKTHPVKEPTVKRERWRLFGASGRFRFRRH